MFSKISRYRKLPDVVTLDARGRTLESKGLRLTPEVPGQARHIVEGSDRLDQLAHKYYRQSRNWWRLCDANPDFASPRALLGNAVEITGHFRLERSSGTPFWPELRRSIAGLHGVIAVTLGTPGDPLPTVETLGETEIFTDIDPALAGDLDEAVRTQQLPAALVADLEARGVDLGSVVRIAPADDGGHEFADPSGELVYVLRSQPPALVLSQRELRHGWTAEISFNAMIVTADELCDQVSALPCDIVEPLIIGRIGKPIALPRNFRP